VPAAVPVVGHGDRPSVHSGVQQNFGLTLAILGAADLERQRDIK
jgi:hypothetical protein